MFLMMKMNIRQNRTKTASVALRIIGIVIGVVVHVSYVASFLLTPRPRTSISGPPPKHVALFSTTAAGATVPATTSDTISSISTFTDSSTSSTSSSSSDVGTLMFVLPQDCHVRKSKFGSTTSTLLVENPSLYDAAFHLAQKTNWYTNNRLKYEIVILNNNDDTDIDTYRKLCHAEIVIAMGIHNDEDTTTTTTTTTSTHALSYIRRLFESRRTMQPYTVRNRLCHFALDCCDSISNTEDEGEGPLASLVGPYDPSARLSVSKFIPWTKIASGRRLHFQMVDLFRRWTSDDFCYGLVVFLHQFAIPDREKNNDNNDNGIDWVKHQTDASWEKGPIRNTKEFYQMITQCSDCIVPCMKDQQCRECLQRMSQLDPRDQATSYRTIVSYESQLLTNISRCIFTKQNIFQCQAQIPIYPIVQPIQTFRNRPLTEEIGRALLVGHLEHEDIALLDHNLQLNVSWMVACGANVAYDQFPNQHQLFYPASRGRDMWYDPYFRVITLDGRNIWCKRHYKVRPGAVPGTFRLSTSDNGVTSDERWTIIGAADDLSWLVVHYAGAAKAVGLQYMGGLLCTPHGNIPTDPVQLSAIYQCLQSAGIQPWELTTVDNRMDTPRAMDAGVPPLNYYRGEIMKSRQKQITITPPAPPVVELVVA